MKKMLVSILGSAMSLGSVAAQAENWTLLAGTKAGYEPELAVSLMVGNVSPENGSSETMTGIELSLNCPLIQPPTNRIRQQVSYSTIDGADFLEINPHYVVEVAPGLEVGGGVGLGYVMTDASDDVGFQIGASAHYFAQGPIFLGAEARLQTVDGDNNTRVAVKLGYRF